MEHEDLCDGALSCNNKKAVTRNIMLRPHPIHNNRQNVLHLLSDINFPPVLLSVNTGTSLTVQLTDPRHQRNALSVLINNTFTVKFFIGLLIH